MMMIIVGVAATVLLAIGAVLAIIRMERGPSMLDRTVAFDVLTTALVGAIAVEAVITRRTESVLILVVLSMVGFVGSVAIARFAAAEPSKPHPADRHVRARRTPHDPSDDEGPSSHDTPATSVQEETP